MKTFDHIPQPRIADLVLTTSGDELLVFDTRNHQLHHLNPVAAATWRVLSEATTLAEVRALVQRELGTPMTTEAVQLAIVSLGDAQLLSEEVSSESLLGNQSRRRFLKRAGLAGAAIPVIASITAPNAAMATSTTDPNSGTFICTTGATNDSANRQCYDVGAVCCNNAGNCGYEPNGLPRDVPCGSCGFWQWNLVDNSYYVQPYEYSDAAMIMKNGQSYGRAKDHPEIVFATFQCK